jgi:hypothetical protein
LEKLGAHVGGGTLRDLDRPIAAWEEEEGLFELVVCGVEKTRAKAVKVGHANTGALCAATLSRPQPATDDDPRLDVTSEAASIVAALVDHGLEQTEHGAFSAAARLPPPAASRWS